MASKEPRADKAPTSIRSLWKGAISFGLVQMPLAGYKRINKKSGAEVTMDNIVRGTRYSRPINSSTTMIITITPNTPLGP